MQSGGGSRPAYHGAVYAIPGYDLRGLLGRSELIDTYRCRGPKVQGRRRAALKLLKVDALPQEQAGLVAQRFLSTGRFASSQSIPGMASVLDCGDCEDGPYIVTELVTGIDVAGLVSYHRNRNPHAAGLTPELASLIAAQVGETLAAAHAVRPSPLHHHALSPGNVRIMADAQVRVLDFGHASLLRGLGHPTGNWAFMAPELLRMPVPAVFEGDGAAADAYSLGILLFFLLTGKPPFEATSLADLATVATRPLPGLAEMPEQIGRTVGALTSASPADRPTSASEIAELLAGKLSHEERRQRIAGELARLRIPWGKKAPSPPEQRKTALVAPPKAAWSSVLAAGLVLVGAVAGIGIAAGLLPNPFRGDRTAKEKAPPKADTPSSKRNSMKISNLAETDVSRSPMIDGSVPTDRVYRPMPKRPLPRVPNRLNLDTTPSGADIWVDGVLRGKTPVDLDLGPGGHRVVLLQDGQRMHKAVYDTTEGEWIRVPLQPPSVTIKGDARLNVSCRSGNRLPIFIDDEDIGRLCPASNLRVTAGPHKVGVFVPMRRAIVETEVEALAGAKPTTAVVND